MTFVGDELPQPDTSTPRLTIPAMATSNHSLRRRNGHNNRATAIPPPTRDHNGNPGRNAAKVPEEVTVTATVTGWLLSVTVDGEKPQVSSAG